MSSRKLTLKNIRMKGIYLIVYLIICTYVFLATGIEGPYCFHFTWPGIGKETLDCETYNEDDNPFTPCIDPLYGSIKQPNLTEIWDYTIKSDNKTYIKWMEPGNVCVRYTYMYNGAVVNVSYFHGKVTEDQVTPVTSGCYVQYTEGYRIEMCACKSKKDSSMPCNSTIRNTYSTIIFAVTAVSLFMYKIFDIS